MKNLILTLLAFSFISFSFSQEKSTIKNMEILKKNSVVVVDYINTELKLDDKSKAVVANAFAEYANNLAKLQRKVGERLEKDPKNIEAKKMQIKKMTEFAELRDGKIMVVLTKKEIEKYKALSVNFDPMTLELKKSKKKGKK